VHRVAAEGYEVGPGSPKLTSGLGQQLTSPLPFSGRLQPLDEVEVE